MANMQVSIEAALKQAEQFEVDNNWEGAIEVLHQALLNRRNKGNNAMMEKIMVSSHFHCHIY